MLALLAREGRRELPMSTPPSQARSGWRNAEAGCESYNASLATGGLRQPDVLWMVYYHPFRSTHHLEQHMSTRWRHMINSNTMRLGPEKLQTTIASLTQPYVHADGIASREPTWSV